MCYDMCDLLVRKICHYFMKLAKAAFELAVNRFRKSFSVKPACLAATENRISRK